MKNKQLKRMLELADIKPTTNEGVKNLSSLELIKNGVDGNTYGIVRENKKYFIKVTEKTGLVKESDFDYIGGLQNKPKYSYSSYEEATKNLNFLFEELNDLYGKGESINILESDQPIEEKKFVLKQKSKKKEEPKMDFDFGDIDSGEELDFDFGDDSSDEKDDEELDFDFGDTDSEDESDEDLDLDSETDDEDDPIKSIQKTTGKLGQKLRDTEDISSDLQKWVAKSVLAALDLGEMEPSDKKDLIKTIKKSDSSEEDGDLDLGEMEESYDSYMEDETGREYSYGVDLALDKYDNLPLSDIDMPIQDKAYLNIDPNLLTKADLEEGNEFTEKLAKTPKGGKFNIGDKEYTDTSNYDSHMDDDLYGPNYDSYMGYDAEFGDRFFDDENYLENEFDRQTWRDEMEREGLFDEPVDENYLDTPRGGEKYDRDELLFDRYGGPIDENFKKRRRLKEDHFNDRMDTIEQEEAYEDLEEMARMNGFQIGWCRKEGDVDPEESVIYLDILDGSKKVAKARINSMGNIELGHMRGKKFIGEPIDSLTDFNEVFIEDESINELEDMFDPRMNPSPAPARPKEKPDVKPGKPDTDKPSRPSRTPFTPPPHIRPGEEPRPKADWDENDSDVEFE